MLVCVFSGGAMKFMSNEAMSWYRELETWPIFLIATAGEAQQSVSGFTSRFVQFARECCEMKNTNATTSETSDAHSPALAGGRSRGLGSGSVESKVSCELMAVFTQASEAYWKDHAGIERFNASLRTPEQLPDKVKRQSEITHSFSAKSGIEHADIRLWFTQPARRRPS